jgi:Na+-translocating ferredoxin:NAD+ oxidoreductase RNF subunit RnfB
VRLAGCGAFAEAVVEGKAPVTGCVVGDRLCQAIAEILGVKFVVQLKQGL